MNVWGYVPPAEPPPYPPPLVGLLSWPLSHVPVLLVVVCAAGPLLVHFTVVPTITVMAAGENEQTWIPTPAPEAHMLPPPPPLRAVELPLLALPTIRHGLSWQIRVP